MVEDALPVSMQSRLGLSLFQVELAPYTSLDLRDIILPHWSVSFVQSGRVETVTRGERAWAMDGDAMVHPPHLPFSEFADGPGTHLYFVFDMQVSPHLDLLRLYPVSPVVRLIAPAEYARTFGQLGVAWAALPSPVRDLQVFALTTALLADVLWGWTEAGRPPRPAALLTTEDRFAGVVSYMADHLDQKITRDDLACRVFLHPGYFDRVFRAAYGVAPLQMLRDLRLRRARQLLESTEETLETIAAACGLGDAAAFSRTFKAQGGVSPGRYRQSAKLTKEGYFKP